MLLALRCIHTFDLELEYLKVEDVKYVTRLVKPEGRRRIMNDSAVSSSPCTCRLSCGRGLQCGCVTTLVKDLSKYARLEKSTALRIVGFLIVPWHLQQRQKY